MDKLNEMIEMYNNGAVLQDIATKYGTYVNKIRRAFIKAKVPLRNKSVAQKQSLEQGRAKHPTEGKVRPQEFREKISEHMASYWEQMDTLEYDRRTQIARTNWSNLTEEEKHEIMKAGHEAVRKASKEGSKLEKHIQKVLTEAGYQIIIHQKGIGTNPDLELDIVVPAIKTAIEIDGPNHFIPIWGDEALQRVIRADLDKAGTILFQGYCFVRVKCWKKNVSQKLLRDVGNMVLAKIQEIDKNPPTGKDKYIELELR